MSWHSLTFLLHLQANVSLADIQEPALSAALSTVERTARDAGHADAKFLARVTDFRKTDDVSAWIDETVETLGAPCPSPTSATRTGTSCSAST